MAASERRSEGIKSFTLGNLNVRPELFMFLRLVQGSVPKDNPTWWRDMEVNDLRHELHECYEALDVALSCDDPDPDILKQRFASMGLFLACLAARMGVLTNDLVPPSARAMINRSSTPAPPQENPPREPDDKPTFYG